MQDIFQILKSLPLFSGIDKRELGSYLAGIGYYRKNYQKGSLLILQGMPYKALYIIIKGQCTGEMTDESGKVLKIEDFKAPYALASALLFADDNRIPVTVRARTDTELIIIKYKDLLALCRRNEQFLINLLKDVANKFTFISNKMVYFKFKSLREKILYYLSTRKSGAGGYVPLGQNFQELSAIFGVERPSLSRALARMEKDGIIVRKGRAVKILKS